MTKTVSLWLPSGYGRGTIIYNKDNEPYEAVESLGTGVGIFNVVPVDVDYAKSRISQGAKVLVSN